MTDKQTAGRHNIILENRSKLFLTGVTEVASFDDSELRIYTELGELLIKGSQMHISDMSVESGELNIEGEISLMALCAMYSQPGEPKNCYSITSTVSNNVERYVTEIDPHIQKVLKAVGCREGIGWVQVMLDEDGHFYIIEMGYRLDGDMMYIPIKSLLGFDTVAWIVDYALGRRNDPAMLPPSQTKAYKRCGSSYMLWTNNDGVIASIEGLDEIAAIPGVTVDSLACVGDELTKYQPLGDILFDTDDIEETCRFIQKVNDTVKITNDRGENVLIYYDDFDYLRKVYEDGLAGK